MLRLSKRICAPVMVVVFLSVPATPTAAQWAYTWTGEATATYGLDPDTWVGLGNWFAGTYPHFPVLGNYMMTHEAIIKFGTPILGIMDIVEGEELCPEADGLLTAIDGGSRLVVSDDPDDGKNPGHVMWGTYSAYGESGGQVEIMIGKQGSGSLQVDGGGVMENNHAVLGRYGGSHGSAVVENLGSRWQIHGRLYVGGGYDAPHPGDITTPEYGLGPASGGGTVSVMSGGRLDSVGGWVGGGPFGVGTVTVSGTDSLWYARQEVDFNFWVPSSSPLVVGYYGNGELNVTAGGEVWCYDLRIGNMDRSRGTLNVGLGGTVRCDDGATIGESFSAFGLARVDGVDATWNVAKGLIVGYDGDGTLEIGNRAHVTVDEWLAIDRGSGSGHVRIDNASLTVGGIAVGDSGTLSWTGGGTLTITGDGGAWGGPPADVGLRELSVPTGGVLVMEGEIKGPFYSAAGSSVLPSGDLVAGDAGSYAGCSLDGVLDVGAHTVTLRSAGFTSLGQSTTLGGGTLSADNGVALGVGDSLSGHGSVQGKVAAVLGSTIVADGSLTLGRSDSGGGFSTQGELHAGRHTITLLDADQAVLGSLTTLGNGTLPGTITADNGLVLNFGGSITGEGVVDTPDDVNTPFLNNGAIAGDSASAIELTGYVKGVGSLNNVVISGTYSFGLSPATVRVGNLTLSETSTLEIEVGKVGWGEYDRLIVTGDGSFEGDLLITLLEGAWVEEGVTFEFLMGDSINAQFQNVIVPRMPNGDPVFSMGSSSNGMALTALETVPEPATMTVLAFGLVSLAARRKRK